MRINRRSMFGLLALLTTPLTVDAQGIGPQRGDTNVTFVNAVGRSIRRVTPDRATLLLVVQSSASTPSEAASSVTRITGAVLDTLAKLGMPAGSASSVAYGVGAARPTQGMGPPMGMPYAARNVITLRISSIDRMTSLTAAALAQGASLVGQPRFETSLEDSLRAAAFKDAVADAQRQGLALAEGMRGRLGRLRDLSADEPMRLSYDQWQQSYFPNESPYDNQMKPPPEVTINVQVRARWELQLPPR